MLVNVSDNIPCPSSEHDRFVNFDSIPTIEASPNSDIHSGPFNYNKLWYVFIPSTHMIDPSRHYG